VLAGDAGRAAALLRQDTDEALAWLESPPPGALIRLALAGRPGAPGGHAGPGSYLEALSLRPSAADRAAYEGWVAGLLAAFDRFRLLCAVREGEWGCVGLNLAIERALAAAGRVPAGQEWYEGRPIVVGRNEPEVGIFNGDTGIVLASESPPAEGSSGGGPSYRAWFAQGSGVRSVALGRLGRVETAFASTVHKAQGSEFEHAVLVLPPEAGSAARRDLVYTAITRARRSFTLVTPNGRALKQALSVRSVRQGGLADQVERGATVPAPAPG
jgi:exodeoxyribonuclease V alpha subunit